MFTTKLSKHIIRAPGASHRALSSLPKFQADLEYLLDPSKREEIRANTARRRGRGDVDAVAEVAKELRGNPEDEYLGARLLHEASAIPNRTHPESASLTEPKVVRTKEFNRMGESLGKKPAVFEKLGGTRLKQFRSDGVKEICSERSYFLTDQLAELEQALVRYTLQRLVKEWDFEVVSVPDILNPAVIEACGMETQGERAQVFHLEVGKEHTASALSGTAEMAFGGMLSGRVIPPGRTLKVCAVSRCFRAETSQTKEERPIFRVTQFTKAEMFAVCDSDCSDEMLEHFLEVQTSLFSELGLAYQVIEMPPGELGAPAYRKYDIEALFPGRMAAGGPPYGEISSCSNCTDFQSRRLNIRNVLDESEKDSAASSFCHTVNGTACAVPRTIMAICEQWQTSEGNVVIPEALVPHMGGARLIEPVPKAKRAATQLIKSPTYFVGRTMPDDEEVVKVKEDAASENQTVVDQINRMKTP